MRMLFFGWNFSLKLRLGPAAGDTGALMGRNTYSSGEDRSGEKA